MSYVVSASVKYIIVAFIFLLVVIVYINLVIDLKMFFVVFVYKVICWLKYWVLFVIAIFNIDWICVFIVSSYLANCNTISKKKFND
jgi:hypothetical protein